MNDSEKLDLILEQLSSINSQMETKFDAIDARFNSIDARLDALETDMADVKADLKQFHRYADMILDEVERVHEFLNDHINDTSKHIA